MPVRAATSKPGVRSGHVTPESNAARGGVSLAANRARPDADLVVGALPNTVRGLLPRVLARLRAQQPDSTVKVIDGNDRQLQARLAVGQIDVLIGRAPHSRYLGQFRFLPLYHEPVLFVVRPHHPLANYGIVEPAALTRFHFLAPQFDAVLAAEVERHLFTEGFATVLEPTAAESLEFALAFIHQSDCILAVPRGIVHGELQGHRLVSLTVDRALPAIPVGALTAPQHPATQILQQLLDTLTDEAVTSHKR